MSEEGERLTPEEVLRVFGVPYRVAYGRPSRWWRLSWPVRRRWWALRRRFEEER